MKLDLYMFPACPYCQRVIRYLESAGREDIIFHDILENEEDRQTLIRVGGMEQVPCLFIDGKPMYESDDIVQWLRVNPPAEGK